MALLSLALVIVLLLRWFTAVRIRAMRARFRRADGSVSALKKQASALRVEARDLRQQLHSFETRRGRLLTEIEEARLELLELCELRHKSTRRIAA